MVSYPLHYLELEFTVVLPPNLTLRFIIAVLRGETVRRLRGYSHWDGQKSLQQTQVRVLRNGVLISE